MAVDQESQCVAERIQFEEFDLDIERYELRRAGHALKLERMPMELLILLLESEGKLVRRDAINRRLWGEHALQDTDHSVNTAINKLRYILRDDPRDPRFIQTVVGQGYRFIAKVAADPVTAAPDVVAVTEWQSSRAGAGQSTRLCRFTGRGRRAYTGEPAARFAQSDL